MSSPNTATQEILITSVGSELQGVGRAADGRTLFVAGALPDERVRVRIDREAERFLVGSLVEVLDAQPSRMQPPCPYAGDCGGCAAQHMDYALSLALKRRKVTDAFMRIGGLQAPPVHEVLPSPQLWHYRNKAEYGCVGAQGRLLIGTNASRTHRLIEVENCLLQHPLSTKLLVAARKHLGPESRQLVSRVNEQGQLMGVVATQGPLLSAQRVAQALLADVPELTSIHHCALRPRPSHALDGKCSLLWGEATLPEHLCGFDYALSPHSFFQINRAQAENLVATLLDALQLGANETVVDAYCGIGTLTLPMARQAGQAIGIEIVSPAIKDARRAAKGNGVNNAQFVCGDAAHELDALLKGGLRPDVVTLDPPRKGVAPNLIAQLIRCRPKKIGYVSCDAATLARDVKLLLASGAYRLDSIQPLDMFPWTEHVETVVLMSRA